MSQFLPKLARYVPLWQRNIPRYPIYWKGNPQLRVYLPLFWMKLLKNERNTPRDLVTFEVHNQMTEFDVKNYLEKIYQVKVLTVKCHLLKGEERTHPRLGYSIQPDRDRRLAWVQLEGEPFEYPDIFGTKQTEDAKSADEHKKLAADSEETVRKQWSQLDMPPWFR